jgi:TolA-binding protein
MPKMRKIFTVLFLSVSVIVLSACSSGQQKKNDENNDANQLKKEVSTELQKKQNKLTQTANEKLAAINEKIKELNNKIGEQSEKLSEDQEEALDKLQDKRVQVNEQLNNLKNISMEEWDDFETNFKEDLDSVIIIADDILDKF